LVGATSNALCRITAAFFLPLGLDVKLHPANAEWRLSLSKRLEDRVLTTVLLATVTR
jgi:hypothetical protein